MAKIKVIHLEMDGQHYYFGSLKALHETMGVERMGMKFNSFHSNVRVTPDSPYTNRRHGYTIRMGYLTQTRTNRTASHLHPLMTEQQGASEEPTFFPEETPIVEETPIIEEMPTVQEVPAEKETHKETPKSKRSKKQKDDFGQLDLFGM